MRVSELLYLVRVRAVPELDFWVEIAGPPAGACAERMAEKTESQTLSKKEQKKLQFFQRLKKKKKPSLNPSEAVNDVDVSLKKRKRKPGPDQKPTKGEGRGKGKRRDVETQIYIGGLPYKMSEDDVKAMFQSCGSIKSINLPINQHGKPTGFGFIVFDSSESIPKALAFDGHEVEGRFIQARPSFSPA